MSYEERKKEINEQIKLIDGSNFIIRSLLSGAKAMWLARLDELENIKR